MKDTNKHIVKSAGIMSFAILTSRVLGFLRVILMAFFFGTGFAAEAFVVAFRLPNMLRDLVAEGSANAALVPVLSDNLIKKSRDDFWLLVGRLFWISLLILSAIAIAGILLAYPVVRLIAPGFIQDPDKFLLTIKLTRIIFPHILLMGLAAFSMATLFTLRSFAVPAFGSAVQNSIFIVAIILSTAYLKQPIYGVAVGVLAGGSLQVAMQFVVLKKNGFRLLSPFALKGKLFSEEIRKIGRLLVPRIFGTAVYQANVFIDTCLASLSAIVGTGAVAAIFYANRLIQLPFALFTVALANASLPVMSTQAAQKDLPALRSTIVFSLKGVLLVMLPASIGLGILSRELVAALFQRGSFDLYSTNITSFALQFYTLGLIFYAGTKILVSCFYAMMDTKTPVKIAGVCLLVNLFFNLILMFPMKVAGLALASSISALVNFTLLAWILNKRIQIFKMKDWSAYIFKIALSALVMGSALYFLKNNLSFLGHFLVQLLFLIFVGILLFLSFCILLKVDEALLLLKWIKTKLKRN